MAMEAGDSDGDDLGEPDSVLGEIDGDEHDGRANPSGDDGKAYSGGCNNTQFLISDLGRWRTARTISTSLPCADVVTSGIVGAFSASALRIICGRPV